MISFSCRGEQREEGGRWTNEVVREEAAQLLLDHAAFELQALGVRRVGHGRDDCKVEARLSVSARAASDVQAGRPDLGQQAGLTVLERVELGEVQLDQPRREHQPLRLLLEAAARASKAIAGQLLL